MEFAEHLISFMENLKTEELALFQVVLHLIQDFAVKLPLAKRRAAINEPIDSALEVVKTKSKK